MSKEMAIGNTVSVPGGIQYEKWEAFKHPTGHVEFLPVIIAQGVEDGPCLWLTSGVHGPEHTGPLVIYELITQTLAKKMKGTIIAVPALSPAGLRTARRDPYHAKKDPNRLWPEEKPPEEDPDEEKPSSLELAYQRLFREIAASADYLIDFHNAWIGSLSFVFRDRVLYPSGNNEEKKKASELAARLDEMVQAYGHTIINEYPAHKYIDEKLHRSVAGSVLLTGKIPSFTAELGSGLMPDPAIIAAACAGTRNVMRWAGMLGDNKEKIRGIKIIDAGFPVRRMRTPSVKEACIVRHLVQPGDLIHKGDPVAETRDVWGRPQGSGDICSNHEGFVIGREHGIYFYPGNPILTMAVIDEAPLVDVYPENYFKDK
jgi:predicted deacylase